MFQQEGEEIGKGVEVPVPADVLDNLIHLVAVVEKIAEFLLKHENHVFKLLRPVTSFALFFPIFAPN